MTKQMLTNEFIEVVNNQDFKSNEYNEVDFMDFKFKF